ncbi:MAG: hypothetical protein ABI874_02995, partial [Chloroflexota bacterium]
MLRSFIHTLIILSLCLAACGPGVPSALTDSAPTAAPLAATVAPSAVPAPPSPAPSFTPTAPVPTIPPLSSVVRERPTPIPAPNCFSSAPTNTGSDYVTSIAVASSSHLIVTIYSPAFARTFVYLSDDSGLTWTSGRVFNDFVSKVVPSPTFARDRIAFAVGAGGVYRSLNGGIGWATISPATWFTTTTLARQFAVSSNFANDHTIVLGSRAAPRGVFASTDGGATWIDWLVDAVDVMLVSPNYGVDHAVWAARNDEQTFRRDVLVTTNQGDQWETVRAGTAVPFAISPAYSQDSTILWMDATSGLYLSRNGDRVFPLLEKAEADALKVWQQNPQSGWVVTGEQPLRDVAFSPNFGTDRLAFATTDSLLAATRDGGASWAPLCNWGGSALRFDHLAVSPNFA